MLHPRSFSSLETPVLIAGIQMNSGDEVAANLATAERLLAEAASAGAQLVALPEFFPLMTAQPSQRLALAEEEGQGPLQDALANWASRWGLWLVAGSLPLKTPIEGKTTNTCLVYGPDGRQAARYDKLHLFGFNQEGEHYNESASFVAGHQPVALDTPFARLGLGICYDLRFPELFRALSEVDLLVIPSAFTVPTGRAHWELLLKARAVENQCYLLAPAQVGEHPGGRKTWGHSLIIDPWGERLACLPSGEGLVMAAFNPMRLAEVRSQLPALAHRRL